jgi:GDP-L-fucose synthase
VIPGMMRRFHEAKLSGAGEVIVWGTGAPLREFLHVDDLADAMYLLMSRYEDAEFMNIGSGEEVTIRGLAEAMADVVGFDGRIRFDPSKPDGTPRKMLDSSRMFGLGWRPRHTLSGGLRETYEWATRAGQLSPELRPA